MHSCDGTHLPHPTRGPPPSRDLNHNLIVRLKGGIPQPTTDRGYPQPRPRVGSSSPNKLFCVKTYRVKNSLWEQAARQVEQELAMGLTSPLSNSLKEGQGTMAVFMGFCCQCRFNINTSSVAPPRPAR